MRAASAIFTVRRYHSITTELPPDGVAFYAGWAGLPGPQGQRMLPFLPCFQRKLPAFILALAEREKVCIWMIDLGNLSSRGAVI